MSEWGIIYSKTTPCYRFSGIWASVWISWFRQSWQGSVPDRCRLWVDISKWSM